MANPFTILKEAIEKVPFVKYALGIAGIASAIAIIKSFGIENYSSIPIFSILVMLGFMVLLFLFSTLTTSQEKPLKLAGYILVYTTVGITCLSSIMLATSVFFDKPKPITSYGIFKKDPVSNNNITSSLKNNPTINDTIKELQIGTEKIRHNVNSKPSNTEPKNKPNEPSSKNNYSPKYILSMTSFQISELIFKLDWNIYELEIINTWKYNDLAHLIYKLKSEVPIFNDKIIYEKSNFRSRSTEFKEWTYENIKSEPKTYYLLWQNFLSPKESEILVRLKNIKDNPTLYSDKIKE